MTTILILCVVGILAILAELVLPGGILGVIGGVSLVAAVILTFVSYGPGAGTLAVAALFVFGFVTLGWWMKFFHRLPLTKRLVLNDKVGEDGERRERQTLVGQEGVALTDLHPSGLAKIGDRRIDVMAESSQISKDTPVKVVAARGPSIIVRQI